MWIRKAKPSDLEPIARIQSTAREAPQWNVEDYLAYDCAVAGQGGAVQGFLAARDLAGEREILNLAVDPSVRRCGIARALLQQELENAATAWFLEVRVSNSAARALYRSLGFEDAGTRRGYYDEPREDAIVMRKFS